MQTRQYPATCKRMTCTWIVTTSDGVQLAVREYGSHRAAHTVVLLHGFCLNQQSWDIQVAQLIRRWGDRVRIITYDHRGHGDSAGASMHTYCIDRLADDLAGLLVALRVRGPLTLAGHSMGGMAALAYAVRPAGHRPVEPQSLVLLATTAGKLTERGVGRLLASGAADLIYEFVDRSPCAATDWATRALVRPVCAALLRYGAYGAVAQQALVTLSAGAINATPLRTKVGFLRGLKNYDKCQALGMITAKTTVIVGGADKLIPPAQARDLAAGIPGSTLIHRPTAGHMLLHEVPQVVSGAINRAIADAQGTSAAVNRHAVGPDTRLLGTGTAAVRDVDRVRGRVRLG